MSLDTSGGVYTARTDHFCDLCGRRIPKGTRYWRVHSEYAMDRHEHTNCCEFTQQPPQRQGVPRV